jgi:hypothetical protein
MVRPDSPEGGWALDMMEADGELDLREYLESAIIDASTSLSLGLYDVPAGTGIWGLRFAYCRGRRFALGWLLLSNADDFLALCDGTSVRSCSDTLAASFSCLSR